jgi:predicted mannosyl-3-phosphoglycerate phosphatase (HAD superfamily)
VFTSVDGALLDARTFEGHESRAAARRLAAAGIPVVPVSVMTFDELAPLAADFGLAHAMVIEAGGAIARWNGAGWDVEPCGPPGETLLDVIRDIEDRSGANLLIYSALRETDAARVSGRSGMMLHASMQRCFSEPILVESGELESVKEAAAAIGFSIRKGRRFFHLCREFDKGEAFMRIREELGCETAIAVGGTAIDAEFLARADVAIIVPGPDGTLDDDLVSSVPGARIAPLPGPAGWALAVEEACRDAAIGLRRTSATG